MKMTDEELVAEILKAEHPVHKMFLYAANGKDELARQYYDEVITKYAPFGDVGLVAPGGIEFNVTKYNVEEQFTALMKKLQE